MIRPEYANHPDFVRRFESEAQIVARLEHPYVVPLYDYWRDLPAKALNDQAEQVGTDVLVNCASQEYFGAADRKALKLRVITPVFMEVKEEKPRIVSFFAKRARGAMARFMVENRVTEVDGIKDFATGGYAYDPDLSEGDKWVFLRDYPT